MTMALIHIKREHGLTREQARAKVEELAQNLHDELKVKHTWDGDVLRFKRTGATGAVGVGETSVEVKIKLGMVLVPMKAKIERAILASLDELQSSG